MELRNCPECGKLFAYVARNLCPACLEKEEEFFKEVESFLKGHRGATVSEISEATGVPEEKIISFLRAGRLITSGTNLVLECDRCGKPIRMGRFCDECRTVLGSSLKGSEQRQAPGQDAGKTPEPDASRSKMHTAELYRRNRSKI